MKTLNQFALRHLDERILAIGLGLVVIAFSLSVGIFQVWASNTSNFTQTINAGTLTADIVDAGYSSVGSPTVAMGAETFSFSCQTANGTFGTATEQLYVSNPDAADNGWTLTMAGSATGSHMGIRNWAWGLSCHWSTWPGQRSVWLMNLTRATCWFISVRSTGRLSIMPDLAGRKAVSSTMNRNGSKPCRELPTG